MIKQLSSTSSHLSPKKGFILLELCLALALALCLSIIMNQTALSIMRSWQSFLQEHQLIQAQNYMFDMLEYELAQNGKQLTITSSGQQLTCKSIYGHKTLSYTHEYLNNHYGLYMTTRNAKGYSKNPLFIPSCELKAWKIEVLSENQLLIKLVLTTGNQTRSYYRVLSLLNGKAHYEE